MECPEYPLGERLQRLGAAETDREQVGSEYRGDFCYANKVPGNGFVIRRSDFKGNSDLERLRSLQEEQEILDASLLALTTHFAQVQFRLRQIVDAPPDEREELLRSLEEFAFKGVPEVWGRLNRANSAEGVRERRNEQQELLEKLKKQVGDLERCPCTTATYNTNLAVSAKKQQFVLRELIVSLNLQLDESDYLRLTKAEIKKRIEQALKPICAKEQLVVELMMQVTDLERFVGYLQDNLRSLRRSCRNGLNFVAKKTPVDAFKIERKILGAISRVLEVFQFILMATLACKMPEALNHSTKTHWGNMRAELEMAVAKVVILVRTYSPSQDIDNVVRHRLSSAICELVRHGARDHGQNVFTSPIANCIFSNTTQIHAWEIILRYYRLKEGDLHNTNVCRKLSESYDLPIEDHFSEEDNLLAAINSVIKLHAPYRQNKDSHFKAFVCSALNSNRLSIWLRLMFACDQLINENYHHWSYAAETRFQDAVESIEALDELAFDLPVDYAVRRFKDIKHLFS